MFQLNTSLLKKKEKEKKRSVNDTCLIIDVCTKKRKKPE